MPALSPQRSCLVCRTVRDKGELLRFVLAPDHTLVPDLLAKLPGRGAYTCISRRCLDGALRKRQFSRAFKVQVEPGPAEDFIASVMSRMEERIASYVALANKAGTVISGTDMVEDAIKKGKAGVVIIASDISEEIGKKLEILAARHSIPWFRALSRDRLGCLVGKSLRGAVAIGTGGFVESVVREIERFRNFSEEGEHA